MKQFLFFALTLVIGMPQSHAEAPRILTNQLGYDSAGPKHAVIQGHAGDSVTTCTVIDIATGQAVMQVAAVPAGAVDKWRDWRYWTLDFDALTTGTYFILSPAPSAANDPVRSFPFKVEHNILERDTLGNVIAYFKGQRSSGLLDKADRHSPFEGNESKTIDAHGGWYDATGDYGKHLSHLSFSNYFNPQQIAFTDWSLFKTYEILTERHDQNFFQYRRRLLDEAMYGADYLVRMKAPDGAFYRSVSAPGSGKKGEDRRIAREAKQYLFLSEAGKGKAAKEAPLPDPLDYQVGFRAGGGMAIAALARAAAYSVSGDFSNADYLKAAEDGFTYIEKNNLKLANDGKENIVDDYCALMAATELYKATKKAKYREAADARFARLKERLISAGGQQHYFRADDKDRPFFHAADAGLPVVALLEYASIPGPVQAVEARQAAWEAMRHELDITSAVPNPFGLARQYVQTKSGERRESFFYPHDADTAPWWQGENARLASLAAAARMLARDLDMQSKPDPQTRMGLHAYAANQLNWILGENPFDVSMLHGTGRNNPDYMFFDSWEYKPAPGGIVNGITGGYADPVHGIDFGLLIDQTGGKDETWRWTEQWLPHASWYMLAVALGE